MRRVVPLWRFIECDRGTEPGFRLVEKLRAYVEVSGYRPPAQEGQAHRPAIEWQRPAGVTIVQSAIPAGVFSALIAIEHDLEPDFVTTMVLTSTVASAVTLVVVLALV